MTKKADLVKVSDYLKQGDDINIRSMMKAIREAFKNDRLDMVQLDESFKIDKDKGIIKAASGDKGIMYDFLIFDVDGFEEWFEEERINHKSQGSNGQPARYSATELLKLRNSNPEEYERIRDLQKKAIKTYDGATGQSNNTASFVKAASLIAENKLSEAETLLKGIRTRAGSKPAQERDRYMKEIQTKRDQLREELGE